MRVLVMDMGSRLNTTGGQTRFAALLLRYFGKMGSAWYIGYETESMPKGKNTIMLQRKALSNPELRKSRFSEVPVFRLLYFLSVRRLAGIGADKGWILEQVKKVAPDVVISNSIQDLPLIRFLRRSGLGFKTIYIDHNCISNSDFSYFSRAGMPFTVGTGVRAASVNAAKRQFFRFFDLCVALNKEQQSRMHNFTDKVVRIPLGVSKPRRERKKEEKLRKKLGIATGKFVIMYLGRMFERQKSISTLIEAFKGMKEDWITLLLIGGGPSLEEYKEAAKGDSRIIITGPVDDPTVDSAFGACDAFVLPSRWEGFSVAPLIAASYGKPIVLSDGAYIEDLKDKKIGEIPHFKTGDAEELAERLEALANYKDAYAHAVAVSERVAKSFSEQRMLESYKKAIERL